MADQWAKVELSTPDKPEIALLARLLSVSRNEAFASWFHVLRWAHRNTTETGLVPHLSPDDVDSLSGAVPGTCAALASSKIGWVEINDGGLSFVNWERHNGSTAKRRLYECERKRRQRSQSRSSPEPAGTKAGTQDGTRIGTKTGPIDKRREEKKPPPPTPSTDAADDPLERAWAAVVAMVSDCGVGRAKQVCDAARARGVSADAVRRQAEHFRQHPGGWEGPGFLHNVIELLEPGVEAPLPEPSAECRAKQRVAEEQRKRDAKIAEQSKRRDQGAAERKRNLELAANGEWPSLRAGLDAAITGETACVANCATKAAGH